jgi:hypothetical protein
MPGTERPGGRLWPTRTGRAGRQLAGGIFVKPYRLLSKEGVSNREVKAITEELIGRPFSAPSVLERFARREEAKRFLR